MRHAPFAQLQVAASLALGRPFSLRALDRLIAATPPALRSNGAPDPLPGTLALDPATRQAMQVRHFRAQARRAARETPYYHALFARLGCDPARLDYAAIMRLPLTSKEALRDQPDAFVRRTARPVFRTTTTGTTGRPTGISFSAYEMAAYAALAALGYQAGGEVTAADIVQISTSARATLGNTCTAAACARVGAQVYLTGLVDPALALAGLREPRRLAGKKPRASRLVTYASYLGEMIETGRQLGLGPADFGLESIFVGGEIVTAGLKARCRALFGPVRFDEGYGMTETWPVTGGCCEQGHLHFEASLGLVEVWNLDTNAPAGPGEVGALVVTPLPPYRETTLVLRYNTEDLVRVPRGPLTCTLRHLPAVSNLLGKRRLAVQHAQGWTYPRQVLEALEALAEGPLPARCGYWAVPGGVAVEVVTRDTGPAARQAIAAALEAQGVPLRELYLVADPTQLHHRFPLRCDLKELSFGTA